MEDEDALTTQINHKESDDDDDDDVLSSTGSTVITQDDISSENDEDDDSGYFAQFTWPEESENTTDDEDYDDEIYLQHHLIAKQIVSIEKFKENNNQRTKRSNKKLHARCQIKTKHARSIKYNSHNKQLYIHHRLAKMIHIDPPSQNYLPSSCSYTWPVYARHEENIPKKTKPSSSSVKPRSPPPPPPVSNQQFREYTVTENNIPNDPIFDDAMITFLLEMQNRDLSPDDYEMLLRLDERVQRKTLDENHLERLPTIVVDQTYLNDQCAICMETYILDQKLKVLPCQHIFHTNCIETYLKEFSIQCPLDNLPLI